SPDDGTTLSATATAGAPVCTSANSADVTISGVVTSTGSVDSAIMTASIDGAPAVQEGIIEPTDFTHHGRIKTADYSLTLSLSNGTHTILVCFTQSGAPHRMPKTACAPLLTIVVNCADPDGGVSCADEEPFGDLVGNPSLCTGNGPPHIPVHVRGD